MPRTLETLNRFKVAKVLPGLMPAILREWEARSRQEVLAARHCDPLSLYDSLPEFLEQLVRTLAAPDPSAQSRVNVEVAREHGEDRAEQGFYTLDEVIREYQVLREVLVEQLEEVGNPDSETRRLLHSFLDCGVRRASVRFTELSTGKLKRVQTQLTFERQKLEAIFRDSPAAMALWRGPDLVFELFNPVYQGIFSRRELAGKPITEALPELQGQPFVALLKSVFATGSPYVGREMLARVVRLEGAAPEDRYFDFSYVAVRDAEGRPYGVYCHALDVTDRVRARHELEKNKESLSFSVRELEQERELRERFVAALSHDLRTPLAAVKLTAQLLARRHGGKAEVGALAARIVGNMDRADRMIRDLLDANRLKAGEGIPIAAESCCLDRILDSAMKDLRDLHGPRVRLQANANKLCGYWDALAIQRILENLAGNAVKYGSPGGPVTITAGQVRNWAQIAVHNEGNAISLEDQKTLFHPYRRTVAAQASGQRGWGIGLTLVKGIVEAHRGTLHLQSDPVHGTTFFLRLPLDESLSTGANASSSGLDLQSGL